MRSRGLNKKINIWKRNQVSDGFGGFTMQDEFITNSWAKIETAKTTARDLNNIGMENMSINLMITVRYREDLQYTGINQFISYKGVSYAFTLAPNEVNLNNTFVKLVATRLKEHVPNLAPPLYQNFVTRVSNDDGTIEARDCAIYFTEKLT